MRVISFSTDRKSNTRSNKEWILHCIFPTRYIETLTSFWKLSNFKYWSVFHKTSVNENQSFLLIPEQLLCSQFFKNKSELRIPCTWEVRSDLYSLGMNRLLFFCGYFLGPGITILLRSSFKQVSAIAIEKINYYGIFWQYFELRACTCTCI